jgi:ectoine hydroxylase-related dioxygenase (phytanoyl-CoA dioxygenase family)
MLPFHITSDQLNEFKTKGYLRLENAVPPLLLAELQSLFTDFNETALKNYGTGSAPSNMSFLEDDGTPILMRVNDLVSVFPTEVLDLLASPAMMAIARDLSGPGTIPLQCDALFKHVHPFSTVLWHQDAVHPRTFPYLNIGIYLDDADAGDGCLTYVKGSQHEKLDICELSKKYGWEVPDSEEVPAKAGDILIQDMMVLHGSRLKTKPGIRRTIYVEMRPEAAVREHNLNSDAWIELRKRWMGIVARRSEVSWPEETHGAMPTDLKSDREEIDNLLQLREAPIPANYCFEGTGMMG